jgi:hypothetical protein
VCTAHQMLLCALLCRCVEVPSDCGGVGKRCCPSLTSMVTDKALPTAAWGGSVCNPAAGPHGAYCDGEQAAHTIQHT